MQREGTNPEQRGMPRPGRPRWHRRHRARHHRRLIHGRHSSHRQKKRSEDALADRSRWATDLTT